MMIGDLNIRGDMGVDVRVMLRFGCLQAKNQPQRTWKRAECRVTVGGSYWIAIKEKVAKLPYRHMHI